MPNFIFPANMAQRGPKGETGAKGNKGDKGDRGAAFTFDDFTPEQLAGITGGIEAEVTAAKNTAIAAVEAKSASAISYINGTVSVAENDIYTAIDTLEVGVDTIANAASEGVASIESAESSALSAIESKVSDGKSTLDSYTDAKTAAVESAGSTAVSAVQSAKTSALAAVSAVEESARGYAQRAQNYADTASDNADAAGTAKDTAVTAKNAAIDAKNSAVSAKTASEAAQTAAETAQSAAEAAQTLAETAAAGISASSAQIETNRTEIIRVEGKVDSETEAETAITVTDLDTINVYIGGGVWKKADESLTAMITPPSAGWGTADFIKVKARSSAGAVINFLKAVPAETEIVLGSEPDFCKYQHTVNVPRNTEQMTAIPSDCKCILITRKTVTQIYTPSAVSLVSKAYGAVETAVKVSNNELAIENHETRIAALEDAFAELCEVLLDG